MPVASLPSVGQRMFVLTDTDEGRRRIMFESKVDAAFTPEGAAPFVVTIDGQKFIHDGDDWRLDTDARTLYLLPADESTIEEVRAAGREQRRFRHEQREAEKERAARIEQAQRRVEQCRDEIRDSGQRVAYSESFVTRMRDELARAERALQERKDAHEKTVPVLRKRLADATAELKSLRGDAV